MKKCKTENFENEGSIIVYNLARCRICIGESYAGGKEMGKKCVVKKLLTATETILSM